MSGYDALLGTLAAQARALVLVDGIPACGKSSLAHALADRIRRDGRDAVVIENDWFIAPSIRSPVALAGGLALALSGRSVDEVERALLDRFLDRPRLDAIQGQVAVALAATAEGRVASLSPPGAWWNLAHAPAWTERTFRLGAGGVVIVEGTLSRAAWLARFPGALCVYVEVPVPTARARFFRRNATPDTRRNLAFSLLARFGPAYRLAAEMIGRDRHPCHVRVDLSDLDAPRVLSALPETRSLSGRSG